MAARENMAMAEQRNQSEEAGVWRENRAHGAAARQRNVILMKIIGVAHQCRKGENNQYG